jgi:hypothetical protein
MSQLDVAILQALRAANGASIRESFLARKQRSTVRKLRHVSMNCAGLVTRSRERTIPAVLSARPIG